MSFPYPESPRALSDHRQIRAGHVRSRPGHARAPASDSQLGAIRVRVSVRAVGASGRNIGLQSATVRICRGEPVAAARFVTRFLLTQRSATPLAAQTRRSMFLFRDSICSFAPYESRLIDGP